MAEKQSMLLMSKKELQQLCAILLNQPKSKVGVCLQKVQAALKASGK